MFDSIVSGMSLINTVRTLEVYLEHQAHIYSDAMKQDSAFKVEVQPGISVVRSRLLNP